MYKHRVWRDQDGAHFFHEHCNIEELSQTGDLGMIQYQKFEYCFQFIFYFALSILNAFHFTITLTFQLTFTFSIFPLVQVKLRGLQVLSLQSIPAHLSANAWARHSTLLFLCYRVDNLVCELTKHVKATCKHIIYNTTV